MDNFIKFVGVVAVTGVTVYAVRLYGHTKKVEGFVEGCKVTIEAYQKEEKKDDNK